MNQHPQDERDENGQKDDFGDKHWSYVHVVAKNPRYETDTDRYQDHREHSFKNEQAINVTCACTQFELLLMKERRHRRDRYKNERSFECRREIKARRDDDCQQRHDDVHSEKGTSKERRTAEQVCCIGWLSLHAQAANRQKNTDLENYYGKSSDLHGSPRAGEPTVCDHCIRKSTAEYRGRMTDEMGLSFRHSWFLLRRLLERFWLLRYAVPIEDRFARRLGPYRNRLNLASCSMDSLQAIHSAFGYIFFRIRKHHKAHATLLPKPFV